MSATNIFMLWQSPHTPLITVSPSRSCAVSTVCCGSGAPSPRAIGGGGTSGELINPNNSSSSWGWWTLSRWKKLKHLQPDGFKFWNICVISTATAPEFNCGKDCGLFWMCYCAASCFSATVPPFLGTSLLCCTPEHSTKEPEQFSSLKKSDISIKHKKDGPTFAAQNINNGGAFHKNP